jgi:hypothetical protein
MNFIKILTVSLSLLFGTTSFAQTNGNSTSVTTDKDSILNELEGEWLLKSTYCGFSNITTIPTYPSVLKFKKLNHTTDSINVLGTAGNSKFYYSNLSYTTGWVIEVLEKYVTVMNDTTLVLSHAFVADGCDDRYERVGISTSVNTQKTSAISVYPNPTSNVVNISSSISDGRIDVINSSGLLIESTTISSATTALNVNNWANGIYHVKISDKDGGIIKSESILVIH